MSDQTLLRVCGYTTGDPYINYKKNAVLVGATWQDYITGVYQNNAWLLTKIDASTNPPTKTWEKLYKWTAIVQEAVISAFCADATYLYVVGAAKIGGQELAGTLAKLDIRDRSEKYHVGLEKATDNTRITHV